jgi:hypothetical protein
VGLPNGWQAWDPCGGNSNRPVECGNCDWKGFEEAVDDYIPDFAQRVDAGMIVPVGVCPATHADSKDGSYPCGSLVYFSDVEIAYRPTPTILDKIVYSLDLQARAEA